MTDLKNIVGKKIIVRADLNVPIIDGKIVDTSRIDNFLSTLKWLKNKQAKIIILSHLGRPKGEWNDEFSLKPIANYMKIPLEKTHIDNLKLNLKNGEAILLENTRFYKGEKKNSSDFAKKLANLGDIFVNDGFSVAHRSHASTVGITEFLPSYAGFQIEKETTELDKILENPTRPTIGLFGGLKVSTKAPILINLLENLDTLVLGGAMANTFLKAKGFEIGESLFEELQIKIAQRIIKIAGDKLILPIDIMTKKKENKNIKDLEKNDVIMDVGEKTIALIKKQIEQHKTLIWNGTFGVCELQPFNNGTEKIAEKIASEDVFSVAGGGDLHAILKSNNLIEKFSFVSTAGGGKKLSEILVGKRISEEVLEQIEDTLITADISPIDAIELVESIKKLPAESSIEKVKKELYNKIFPVLKKAESAFELNNSLHVILVAGVNGAGKTTTLFKLANYFQLQGKKVAVAGCDSFRAGAIQQLADRMKLLDIDVFGEMRKDPSGIAYQALEQAKKDNANVLLIDTAGRLHDNENLMSELKKIHRVLGKQGDFPQDCWLVLDGTSGQNTISQVDFFSKTIPISGLIITKLDSTAKGGFIYSLLRKFELPVVFLGTGEKKENLEKFNAESFAKTLLK